MSPDAAEHWLEAEPEPAEPPPPSESVEEGPPTGTTTTTPEPPEPVEPPPDVSGMSPDAAEQWLEPDPPPQPPAADPEREQRFDTAPGCIPVQGPYLSEADRPCSFPDGTRIPTRQIGTQPEEARPCVPVQGPYLNEADRPCAFPDGREIPSELVVEPPPPYPADCAPVGGGL
jgi:hypothetical protein